MKFFTSRKVSAIFCAIISALVALFLGAVVALCCGEFYRTVKLSIMMYLLFCAPLTLMAILLLITNISEDCVSWISYGLYYGTLGISVLIDKFGWYMPDEAKYIIGAVISGLICYIVWLKKQPKK